MQRQAFPDAMRLTLLDKSGTAMGEIHVTAEDSVVQGDFLPAPAFSMHASIFAHHEKAANEQRLVDADLLEQEINSLDFHVLDPRSGSERCIIDLQIMEGGLSFRWVQTRSAGPPLSSEAG